MNGLHGIIFAYEKAPGLRELTEARMPGSVPFGGRYRVVDFMLSNMAGAGITDIFKSTAGTARNNSLIYIKLSVSYFAL